MKHSIANVAIRNHIQISSREKEVRANILDLDKKVQKAKYPTWKEVPVLPICGHEQNKFFKKNFEVSDQDRDTVDD